MVFGVSACAPSSPRDTADAFSTQDLMFASMMIPHHEQAVEMGNIALENSLDPAIIDIARRIVDGQDTEIVQMKGWLSESSWDDDTTMMDHEAMGHDMHGGMGMMSGMVSEEEIESLSTLASPAFERQFLELMIAHHEGAISMVAMIRNSTNQEARELAKAITTAQKQEIREMEILLQGLPR